MAVVNVPGAAWVGLALILIPTVQAFVATQWPEASFPITVLVVGVLGGFAKWLQMFFTAQAKKEAAEAARALAPPDGVAAFSAPAPEKEPSRLLVWLVG